MRPVANWGWFRRVACVVVAAVVILTMAEPVTSQSYIDRNSSVIRYYCSLYTVSNSQYFLANLNSTLSNLRRQLSTNRPPYAVARTVINGEAVWGLAICRYYVSTARCLACFDAAVVFLRVCGLGNGANAYFDDCDIRYENNNFYPEIRPFASVIQCSNDTTSSSQPTPFRRAVDGLLSDLLKATPKTSNYYAASTRQIAGSNTSVYAFGQCYLNLSQSICAECLQNRYSTIVRCLPGTFGKALDKGCFMRYSAIPFFRDNQTTDLRPFLKGNSRKKRAIIGGVVGGVCFLLLVVVAFLLWHRQSRKSSGGRKGESTGETDLLQGPIAYGYDDLKMATNNFSEDHKLGGGVFGEVYKGNLKDGHTVAIKKIDIASKRGKPYFDDELRVISNVHHRHLIRLLGYCSKGPHLFLVLEYMENGSLDKYLFGEKRGSLSWKQRLDIIFATARGLVYLHEQYHVTIIHRDIKSSNILLDNELQPKISDFGLIRLLPEDKTHLTTRFAGTTYRGFVAPEYAIHGQLSEKVDTYSFGVLVLEIISGKKYNDLIEDESGTQFNLIDHAWNLYERKMHLNLIDDTLDPSEYTEEDAKRIIEIALMCTQSQASERPAMSEVDALLSEKSIDERPPTRTSFVNYDDKNNVDNSTSYPSSTSNATASTTTEVSGR